MFYLLGALGYALVVVLLGGAAHAGALLGARWIGRKPFRWFDAAPAAISPGRSVAVRALSVAAALLVAFAFQVAAPLVDGRSEPTLNVDVMPGPAKRAGMLNGDRVVSVDGKVVSSWDEIRNEVRRRPGERRLELERAGQRLSLSVTPEDGRIGITPRQQRVPVSLPSALAGAADSLWAYPRGILKAAFSSTERTQLVGPVGIVKSVGGENGQGSRLLMLAIFASVGWPSVLAVHLFDALSLALFRVTHRWAASADADTARHARLFQTLLVCALCLLAYGALQTIHAGANFGNGAMPGIVGLAPAASSAVLLIAIAARWRFGLGAAIGLALASVTIPCAAFVFIGLAAYWHYAELRRRGYEVSWLVVLPRAAS